MTNKTATKTKPVPSDQPTPDPCGQMQRLVSLAVEKWGHASQMLQTMEECGELVSATNQFLRGRKSKYQLAEEIADVEIMCSQMRYMIGDEIVEIEKHKKIVRLGESLGLHNNV